MNKSIPCFDEVVNAACNNDLATIESLIENGFDKEAVDDYAEPILSEIVFGLLSEPSSLPFRYDIVKHLLKLGFNPNHNDKEGSSPLTQVMLSMDTEMLQVLLDGGALPNEVTDFFENSTLYDWAKVDYALEIWNVNQFPEEPIENDLANDDNWLKWLDAMAIKDNRRRPDHLFLLRDCGARGKSELE